MDPSNTPSSDVASTSSAAAPAKVAPKSYDVFICHRGPDTKATVVDLLRAFLQSKVITCFVDYQMEEGVDFPPTLIQNIHNSKVHIIVLSPRFAESSWCLDEVEEIMEMRKDSKPKTHVLPIFFNVEPGHVRHQRSGSAYDLSQLHKGSTTAKIDRWSQALAGLADINGFIWATDRFQGQMIEEIVSRVDELLGDCLPVYADSTLVSRYADQIKQAEQMLCLHDDDNVVSIGVCGHDKSRFAMALYNKFRQHFPASCILLDVKGMVKCKQDLVKLQMKLLQRLMNVGNIPPRIHDTVQGLELLLDRLKHVKCFIVLDDIEDDDEQLRSLLVLNQHQLCRGSRLVLTSRYPRVLDTRAQVKGTIHLRHIGTEGEVEDGKHLAICWESNDVHEGFIDHLNESLSMLGLDVSKVRGVDMLNWAYQKQAGVILVILSRCFVADSTLMQGLYEASRLCPKVKLVRIYYGRMDSLQTEIAPSTSHGMLGAMKLSRSLSKIALQFSADFEYTSWLDMVAFKSLLNDIVLNHMQHEYEMYVTKFPVGLTKSQVKLESQIRGSMSKRKVGTFGILGMGGIGKTTLAKSLYNRIYKEFVGAIFLLDVATKAKESGLISLQETLVTALGKDPKDPPIKNVEEGKARLTRRLYGTNILVILDNINHTSQLHALFSPLDLGPGSVVVITTRDRSILDAANLNHHPYEMEYLGQENAKRLFYWHAFLKPFPPSGLEMIAQKVINACGGLPLSLEVIGAHVFNHNDPAYWEDTLLHLRKAGNEIFEKLRVSVDVLESYQKEAFLDVCCFLIGKPFQTALRIWEACGWAGKTCGHVLKSKCLITVDPIDGTIGMHDQIRDMGRYIADRCTPRTHIWDAKDASDIPQGGIDDLRGFAMISQEEDEYYKEEEKEKYCEASDLARLCRLKILLLRNLQIIGGDLSMLRYDQFRWLQWQKSPFVNLPPGLYCSRQLRVLDLSGSVKLETLWGSSQSAKREVPDQSLQELNLSNCYYLRELTQFDVHLRNLEWLSLSRCQSLSYLHGSIGSLKKLKFLDLSYCFHLRSLPDTIDGLHSLEKLDLSRCERLQHLPEGIGRCCNLIEINLSKSGVMKLPESIGELRKLEKLNLERCRSLEQLPVRFCELTSLIELNLHSCSNLQSLPFMIEGLPSLEELDLSYCESLDSLPEAIGRCHNLIEIDLSWTRVMNLPESIGELRKLEKLNLSLCESLDSLPEGIGRCCNLIEINLYKTGAMKLPESIGELRKLEKLNLGCCKNLERLPVRFCELTGLIELDLQNCSSLRSLPDTIEGLHSLEKLDLLYCKRLDSLPEGIGRCRNLIEIYLSESGVRKLPESISELRKLEKLNLSLCESLDSLPEGIGGCCNLIEINLSESGVTKLPESIGELRKLEKLNLSLCESLKHLPVRFCELTSLIEWDLDGCSSLRSLPDTMEGADPHSLEKLDLSYCKSLGSLPEGIGRCCNLIEINLSESGVMKLPESIGELRKLEKLNLGWCKSLNQLPLRFCELSSLIKLDLYGCSSLRSLPDTIEGLHSLEKLHLSLCKSLDSLPEGIGRCHNLIEIDLSWTGVMKLPESFGELRKLEKLNLSICESLDSLPEGIGRCCNLIEINFSWTGVTKLPESIGEFRKLVKLNLRWCKSLEQLPVRFCELTSLIELGLHQCSSLRSLPDTIGGLHSLEKLDLSYCKSLDSLPEGIGTCRNLIEINFSWTGVTKLPESIGELRKLEKLNLGWCRSLEQLPVRFCELTSLIELNLHSCSNLRSLPYMIEGLPSLAELDLSECRSLQILPEGIGRCRNLIAIRLSGTGLARQLVAATAGFQV